MERVLPNRPGYLGDLCNVPIAIDISALKFKAHPEYVHTCCCHLDAFLYDHLLRGNENEV